MSKDNFQPVKLPYRYEFAVDELSAIKACHDEHGFAVVKNVLSPDYVEELKESVGQVLDPEGYLGLGETRTKHAFIEYSKPLWKLLENEEYVNINRSILDTDALTIHRSAAILKNVESGPVLWHTDWCGFSEPPPKHSGDVLNRGDWPNGMWFYLNGTHPSRAGLAVIADSHRADWRPPDGFEFTADQRSFHRTGEEPKPYDRMDMPGTVPLFTEPGDLIIFAARTYHGAFPHGGDEPRLSCGFIFRPTQEKLSIPWQLPESAHQFMEGLSPQLQHFVEDYPSIDIGWKPAN